MLRLAIVTLSALLTVSTSLPWDSPPQTFMATHTANWSPAPTNDYRAAFGLLPRAIYPNSICGFIAGSVSLLASCSTDSSCAWNSDESYVGCCATINNQCTFYTSCVDENSPQQTGDNANVYTWWVNIFINFKVIGIGTSLCYRNTYPSSYYQWGCGSTDFATFIATTNDESGYVAVVFTGNSVVQSTPVSTGFTVITSSSTVVSTSTSIRAASPSLSPSPSSSSSSTESVAQSSSSTDSSKTSTTATFSSSSSSIFPSSSSVSITSSSPASSSSTSATAAAGSQTSSRPSPTTTPKSTPIGAIIGGVIGGLALLFALLCFCFVGRRRGWFDPDSNNNRRSQSTYAGDVPPRYSTPMSVAYDPVAKAELATHEHNVQEMSTIGSEGSEGREGMSPMGSPDSVSGGTMGPRWDFASPAINDELFLPNTRNENRVPLFEVQ